LLAAQTTLASGLHELSFTGATAAMQVYAGDTLFAWVYLDKREPALGDPAGLERRLVLGAPRVLGRQHRHVRDQRDRRPLLCGPASRRRHWVKLSVPAAAVGLAGSAVSGMDFSLYDGRATWDAIGRSSASP
jgi:hypothetical protein